MVLVCLLAAGCARRAEPSREVSLGSCLRDLTNLAALARTPAGRMAMISTFDRTGGNRDWGSFDGITDDGWFTLADLKGPGCLKRLWHVGMTPDAWRFYVDGEGEPRIRVGQRGVWQEEPFLPPMCDYVSGGAYSYLPIPYAKSLRIAVHIPADKRTGAMPFYHVNYDTYGRGVRVESFPGQIGGADRALLEGAREAWRRREREAETAAAPGAGAEAFTVGAGQTAAWLDRPGPGTLREFWIAIEGTEGLTALMRARLLRLLFLRITWDGAPEPSVDVPLGDFFCNGLNYRTFSSLPLSARRQQFASRFPMPFRKAVRAEIRNEAPVPVSLRVAFDLDPAPPAPGGDNYFHARWSQSMGGGGPLSALDARGAGHLAGCYLISYGMDGTWTMLEGDETIRVDGEASPCWRGTGIEDYFNCGWYYSGLCALPLHGVLEKAAMQTTQYRFHLPDAVRFGRSLQMSFEFGDGNQARGYMSAVAYWYQREPCPAGTALPPPERRFAPPEAVGRAALMAELFELERKGLPAEAEERCLIHADEYRGAPENPVVLLRALAYGEAAGGYAGVAEAYRRAAAQEAGKDAGAEAAALLWFHEAPTNALVGAHMNGRYRVFLDGRPAGEGDSPVRLAVERAAVGPGEHELAVEVTPTRADAWMSLHLRAHGTNVTSDGTWECARARPRDWPATGDPAVAWQKVQSGHEFLPKMAYWQFMPNAFVFMQSGRQLVRAWAGWDANPGAVTAYFRKRFVLPGP